MGPSGEPHPGSIPYPGPAGKGKTIKKPRLSGKIGKNGKTGKNGKMEKPGKPGPADSGQQKTAGAQTGQPRSTFIQCLLLLPSGPDRVHTDQSHGTQPSSRQRQSQVYCVSRKKASGKTNKKSKKPGTQNLTRARSPHKIESVVLSAGADRGPRKRQGGRA